MLTKNENNKGEMKTEEKWNEKKTWKENEKMKTKKLNGNEK